MNVLALCLWLAAALAAEAPYKHAAASPLLDPSFTSLDTDLERLHGMADDLRLRMQGAEAAALAAQAAPRWASAGAGVWRHARLLPEGPRRYAPVFSESWTEPGADLPRGLENLPAPFFRHGGRLYLVLRRQAPAPGPGLERLGYWLKRLWRRAAPKTTILYAIDDATGRAVPLFELPTPPEGGPALVIQSAPDRFLVATPGRRMHLVTVDFRRL